MVIEVAKQTKIWQNMGTKVSGVLTKCGLIKDWILNFVVTFTMEQAIIHLDSSGGREIVANNKHTKSPKNIQSVKNDQPLGIEGKMISVSSKAADQ